MDDIVVLYGCPSSPFDPKDSPKINAFERMLKNMTHYCSCMKKLKKSWKFCPHCGNGITHGKPKKQG